MSGLAPGTGFWGTGLGLDPERDALDAAEATELFIVLARRIHGLEYDYTPTTLLGGSLKLALAKPVLIRTLEGDDLVMPPILHLMSPDGRGFA